MQKIYCRSIRPDGYGEGVVPERDMINIPVVRGYDENGKIHNDWQKWLDQKDHLTSLPVLYLIHPDLAKVGWVGEYRERYEREGKYVDHNYVQIEKEEFDLTDPRYRRIVLVPVEGKEERYEVFESNNDCPGRWKAATKQQYDACTFEPHRRIISSDKAEEKEVVSDPYTKCREILQELVYLKSIKGIPAFEKEYEERKPKAWAAAKIFLGSNRKPTPGTGEAVELEELYAEFVNNYQGVLPMPAGAFYRFLSDRQYQLFKQQTTKP